MAKTFPHLKPVDYSEWNALTGRAEGGKPAYSELTLGDVLNDDILTSLAGIKARHHMVLIINTMIHLTMFEVLNLTSQVTNYINRYS